ncbi:MAG TPA: tetraacyldisaccharide 4'-kinase [Alphaproteobacteria bacterium]
MNDHFTSLKNRLFQPPAFWRDNDAWQTRSLNPIGRLYGKLVTWRATRAPRYKAPVPVICVGNFTLGGSGKTPTVHAIARILQAAGKKPAILLRGYGGASKGPLLVDVTQHGVRMVGDEAMLHVHVAPTWVSADRVAGAKAIVAKGDADCIIMDDGAQNPNLHKDFTLNVIDGGTGFGNQRVFPAGPLREDIRPALERTSAILMIGNDQTNLLPRLQNRKNLFTGQIVIAEDIDHLRQQAIFAFAGIGRPQKFYQTLRKAGLNVLGTKDYPDHYPFTAYDLKILQQQADQHHAQLVTTTKDWVRIPSGYQHLVQFLPVALEIDQEQTLSQFLLSLWAK